MSSTSLPGPSSGPENHLVPSAGASDEPSMDFQETQVDFTTQRHETPLAHKAAQDNDGNWNIVMRKRSKKQLNKESVSLHQASCQEKNANKPLCNKEEASQGFRARNSGKPPIRRKLPPLPKSDIKVIIRPKKGLLVSNYNNHDIARSIVAACGDPHKCKDGDILTRLRHGSNIIIVSTPSEQAADAIRKLDKINLQGQMHEVNAYVAAPEGVSKGVIHGVDRGTTSEELLAHLRVRTQGVKILHARMLGQTKTAVITFDGDFVPRYVNYYGGEEPCYPYKPTKQVCKVCNRLGHRSDVCPHPENPACERCGTENPEQDHTCELQCALCGEAHLTGDTHCKKKLKPIRRHVPRSAQKHTGTAGRRKWFSSDKDFDSSGNELEATKRQPRSLSRSQSAGNEFTTTEDDTSSTSSAPTAKKMKKKKTKKASRKTADHQNPPSSHELRWADIASSAAPKHKNLSQLEQENNSLKKELQKLQKQLQTERQDSLRRIRELELKLTNKINQLEHLEPSKTAPLLTQQQKQVAAEAMEVAIPTLDNPSIGNNLTANDIKDIFLEHFRHFAEQFNERQEKLRSELETQRCYTEEALGSMQRQLNKRTGTTLKLKGAKASRIDNDESQTSGTDLPAELKK